jgi:hypothetical protein
MLHSASRRLQLLLHEDTPTTASGSTSGPTSGPASGPTSGPTSGRASGQAVQHQELPLVQPAALLWDQLAGQRVLVQLWVPPPDQPVAQRWDLLLNPLAALLQDLPVVLLKDLLQDLLVAQPLDLRSDAQAAQLRDLLWDPLAAQLWVLLHLRANNWTHFWTY